MVNVGKALWVWDQVCCHKSHWNAPKSNIEHRPVEIESDEVPNPQLTNSESQTCCWSSLEPLSCTQLTGSLMLTACDQAAANHFAHRPELHIRHTSKKYPMVASKSPEMLSITAFQNSRTFARAGKMTRTSKSNAFKIQIHSILLVWKKTQLKSHKIRIVAAKSRYCVIADTPAEAYESFMPDGQKVKDLAREQDLRYQILPFNLSVPPLLNAWSMCERKAATSLAFNLSLAAIYWASPKRRSNQATPGFNKLTN